MCAACAAIVMVPKGGGWAMVCVILCTVTEVLSTFVTQAERLLTVWAT